MTLLLLTTDRSMQLWSTPMGTAADMVECLMIRKVPDICELDFVARMTLGYLTYDCKTELVFFGLS